MDNRTFFHTVAYRGSVGAGLANVAIAGVADPIVARDANSNFLSPNGVTINWGVAGGINNVRTRINTASLREVALPYLAPINQTLTVPSPPNLAYFGDAGPKPRPADAISVEATSADAGAQTYYALLNFSFGRREPTPGKEYRTRFTAAITAVAGSWVNGAITLDQVLPAGIYQICGMDIFGTNLIAGRLVFPGGGWRPGVYARNAVNNVPHRIFLDGTLGVFGEFNSVAMPTLDIYAEGANTSQEGYLDLVQVGPYTAASLL